MQSGLASGYIFSDRLLLQDVEITICRRQYHHLASQFYTPTLLLQHYHSIYISLACCVRTTRLRDPPSQATIWTTVEGRKGMESCIYICSPGRLDSNPTAHLPIRLLHTRSFGEVGMVLVEISGLRPLRPNGKHDSSSTSMEFSWDTKISDIFLSLFKGQNMEPPVVGPQ